MLLAQTKEREHRFRLALRMGLPVFALMVAFVSHTLIGNYATLQASFYVESIILLVFSIYFFLYLIYNGYEVKITDDITKTFTREYLFSYLKKELSKKEDYSLVLISVDNISDINSIYGIKNGDRVLEETAIWIETYLKTQKIENYPIGNIKSGDFILGLKGLEDEYNTTLDLMCLKSNEFKVDDIEVKISISISDTKYSKDLDYIIENLFELQKSRRNSKAKSSEELINPNDLELSVIDAINSRRLSIMTQDVFMESELGFKECFIKLKSANGKILFPKAYMKVINKLGLGVEYDLMILETLIQSLKTDDTNCYAINISPPSLRNNKFLLQTKELLKDINAKIMFVLSELEYYSHTSRYNTLLNSLKKSGVLIAIDRLGSIHTSFLYLRELNIDVVRFDTYYSNASKIESNRAIVDGFNTMAQDKGIKTWLKNIEEPKTLEFAKSLNIDYTQGKELTDLQLIYEN